VVAGFSRREALRAASEATRLLALAIMDIQEAVKELLAVDVDRVGWEDWERITHAVDTAEELVTHAVEEVGALKRQLEQLRELINERNLAEMKAEIIGGMAEAG
jgi:hypothetical protein